RPRLPGTRGAYRRGGPLQAMSIPASVHAILAARIDRLAAEDKQLLQTAAIVGKDVPFVLLAAVADLDDAALRHGLGRLMTAEFIYEAQLFPELEYTFKHTLTHEVAYSSLLGERRRAVHGRIVEAIERVHGERLDEHVERLPPHARGARGGGKGAPPVARARGPGRA